MLFAATKCDNKICMYKQVHMFTQMYHLLFYYCNSNPNQCTCKHGSYYVIFMFIVVVSKIVCGVSLSMLSYCVASDRMPLPGMLS